MNGDADKWWLLDNCINWVILSNSIVFLFNPIWEILWRQPVWRDDRGSPEDSWVMSVDADFTGGMRFDHRKGLRVQNDDLRKNNGGTLRIYIHILYCCLRVRIWSYDESVCMCPKELTKRCVKHQSCQVRKEAHAMSVYGSMYRDIHMGVYLHI